MKNPIAVPLCLLLCSGVSFARQPNQTRPAAKSFEDLAQQRQQYPFADPKLPMEQRISDLLSRMTSDEKVACLGTQTGVPRLGVPNIGASEGIHGVVQREERFGRKPVTTTQFPQPPGMAETWDPEIVREAGGVQGYEARYITQTPQYNRQILMVWGPQSDLMRDPRWGRSEEVYGEDPFFNGTMAVAFTKGIQGDDPKYWQAAALLKHFLANENEDHRNTSSSDFDERLFWEYYSVPFRMAFLDADAKAVMASYNGWNGMPMAVNPILKSIVRDKWGVEVISSDGGAVRLLWDSRKLYHNQQEAVVACLKAGINQFLDKWSDETKAALKDGSLTEKEIDELLRPKFRVTIRLGLLDPPDLVPYSKVKDGPEPWNGDKHREISKKMALESVVLLKNEKDFLPLNKDGIKSIAVVGPLANTVEWDWYGGTPPYRVTPLDGIKAALPGNVKVNFAADNTNGMIVQALKKSEMAVVVIGNNPTCGDMTQAWYDNYEGGGVTLPCTNPSDGREGRDRESIDTTQEQIVKQAYEATKGKVVVVLVSSFPLAINWTQEHVPAILHMAHSSQDEGTALAQVLFGDYNPGGHTVETWPKSLDQLPPMMDYNICHGKTYMYFKGEPLYPFGFGLSYTTFKYANLRTSAPQVAKNGEVTANVDVTNTGSRAGDAVVQLYVKHLASKVERPDKELKGFKRVTLQPGETKTVEIPLKASQLAYWDDKAKYFRVETEPVRLMAGGSSAGPQASTTLRVQ
jgi:beta-glucosidase